LSTSTSSAKLRLLNASLQNVSQYGWTEEAISAGIEAENLPISMVGLITPPELVEWFMQSTNEQFACKLNQIEKKGLTTEERINIALRTRLEYVVPFRSKWHQGMGLGATENAVVTADQLKEIMSLISNWVVHESEDGATPLSQVKKTAIGAVYVATELHLLSDESNNQEKTWQFLRGRVRELHQLAQYRPILDSNVLVAASAVATSLAGAAVSLVQPSAQGILLSLLSQFPGTEPTTGTSAEDYYSSLPPLPGETTTKIKS